MHRFFLDKKNILNDTIVIQGSDATHIRNVLRLHAGEEIEVFVGGFFFDGNREGRITQVFKSMFSRILPYI